MKMKFALKNLWKEKIPFVLYGITIIFSLCICQIFLGILDHPYFQLNTGNTDLPYISYVMGSMISLIVIGMCCFLLIYTGQYFLVSKSKELGLMRSLGMTLKQLICYFIYQNTFMFAVFGTIGVAISFVLYPILLMIGGTYNSQLTVQTLSVSSIIGNIGLFATIYVVIIAFHIGYIYRSQLKGLLSFRNKRNHVFHINKNVYPIVYVFGFIMMAMSNHNGAGYIFYAFLCTIASYGLMKQFIPELIEKAYQKERIHQSQQMIVFGHLRKRMKNMSLFICMLLLISTIFIAMISFNLSDDKEMLRSLLAYFIVYAFIVLAMTYKNYLFIDEHIQSLFYLEKIGLTKTNMKKVLFKELFIFYLLLIVLPLVYIVFILIKCYVYQQIQFYLMIILIIYFISLLVLSFIVIDLLSLKKVRKEKWK